MSNRLAQETSPYLKQHQDNPVDWYPWGKEALEKALREDKPVLLSVGYSACHWCHVMAHESFENSTIAEQMNKNFVCIKVDREERPDLDQIYQNVAQAMTGGGGWPLTVFLTPDLRPFFGGTYYPPEDRWGRPGFPRLLDALSNAYQRDRASVLENATKLTDFITTLEGAPTQAQHETPLTLLSLEKAAETLLSRMDWSEGGLAGAPKFPSPMLLSFLWRVQQVSQNEKLTETCHAMVLLSLRKMACGGIYDQLGGGFHRYSVDDTWSVPHFEKMLYDNALLLKVYSEVLLTADQLPESDRILFRRTVEETAGYVLREMKSPTGGFYAAQDADSEGEEGKFFVWDLGDLAAALNEEEAKVFANVYGVSKSGNFEHGKTVLFQAQAPESVKDPLVLASARKKLFELRSGRIKPGLDNKVLTSWNGLMISGLLWASQATGDHAAAEAAESTFFSLFAGKIAGIGGRLSATIQEGQAKWNAYLDDYAFLAQAALEIARFTNDEDKRDQALGLASAWMRTVENYFSAEDGGAFYFTSSDHEKLLQRPRTIYDQAIPSGSAVSWQCFEVLRVLGKAESTQKSKAGFEAAFSSAVKNPFGLGETLCAALLLERGPVTVSGDRASKSAIHPWVFTAPKKGNGTLVCHRESCSLPLSSPEEIQKMINQALGFRA